MIHVHKIHSRENPCIGEIRKKVTGNKILFTVYNNRAVNIILRIMIRWYSIYNHINTYIIKWCKSWSFIVNESTNGKSQLSTVCLSRTITSTTVKEYYVTVMFGVRICTANKIQYSNQVQLQVVVVNGRIKAYTVPFSACKCLAALLNFIRALT